MDKKIKYITNTVNKKIVRIEDGEYLDGTKQEIDNHLSSDRWELTREIHVGEWRFHEFTRVRVGGDDIAGADRSDKRVSVAGDNPVLSDGLSKI
jgi:hypothetical protein